MVSQRKRYELFIFITGAVTLALEVLSSRIMTPYFGVSLFIWSGILSITLSFLAIGYWAGGKAAIGKTPEQLLTLFLAGPAAASIAIGIAAILYPAVFPVLAEFDLVVGSFVGGAILLAVPIVSLSAMNPLLVALRRESDPQGDAGAGWVFFVSTVGSVAGVLLTAFVFIPLFTNFRAMLLLGVVIGLGTMALAALATRPMASARRAILSAAALGVALCVALAAGRDAYLGALTAEGDIGFEIVAQYSSLYGTIKVADAISAGGNSRFYLQEGLVQNHIGPDGISLSLHTHALEELSFAFTQNPRSALVLGLAAGLVPMRFKQAGMSVTVVDINPHAPVVASRYFGFDANGIDVRIEDARTYVRHCRADSAPGNDRADRGRFDIVVLDLFHGDGTPDYLMTAEFFADVAACLNRNGIVVMNTFFDGRNNAPNLRVLATIASSFGVVLEFRSPSGGAFLVGTNTALPSQISIPGTQVPESLRSAFAATVTFGRLVGPADLQGAKPFTDHQNAFSFIFARAEMEHRQWWAASLPPKLLVN